MSADPRSLIARPPVQLTFDRFIIGPENQFAAVAAKMLAGPGQPCFNPLVIRGVQGAGKSMLLRAMGTEYGRLAPSKNVALGLGTELLRAHAAGDLSVLAQADFLLLDEVDGLRAGPTRALERMLRERAEAGRLTVLALQIGQGAGLLRFCTKEFPRGLSVELLPPSADTRREILLRHLREHGVAVEEAASASLTFVPWESAVDVESLGERLLHAAFSRRGALTAAMVRKLGESLGRRGSDVAAGKAPACCKYKLRGTLAPGRWPTDGDEHRPPQETSTTTFRRFCRAVELRLRRWPDRLRLELRSDHESRVGTRFELELRTKPFLSLRVRRGGAWSSHSWGLAAGLTRSRHDPFVDACRWAFRALVPFNPHRRRNGHRASCPEITILVRQVRATIREAACAAAALLDQDARKIALRFPAHMRMWLCRHLAADTSGRLAQLAQACPGALIFAYALAKLGHRAGVGAAGGKLLRDAIAGRGLNEILDDAVAAWATGAVRLAQNQRAPGERHLIWQRVVDARGGERQALLRAQRLLIRRAGAGVPSRTLWLPPPLAFAPEDIPARKLENARWFRVMKCFSPLLVSYEGLLLEYGRNICLFLSRHALSLHKREDLGHSDHSRISSLLDYVRAINDWPRRDSSATRLFEAAETWHRQIEQAQLMADAGRMVGQSLVGADGKTLPLPEPPCPGWHSGQDRIVPLRTAEEVLAEGAHMHNCVASYIPKVLANTAALYHGEIAGKPLTIQIAPAISGYRVVEAKTLGNAEPTAAQMRVLREFIAHFCGGVIAGGARCRCRERPSLGETDHATPP